MKTVKNSNRKKITAVVILLLSVFSISANPFKNGNGEDYTGFGTLYILGMIFTVVMFWFIRILIISAKEPKPLKFSTPGHFNNIENKRVIRKTA